MVLGPLWVWLALDERPSTLTLTGGAIVIAAIVIQTRGAPLPRPTRSRCSPRRTERRQRRAAAADSGTIASSGKSMS